ncbi:MAG: alpha/beta hydrolase, partial [Psychrosphaera sp.]|nr:alpha/beta hydrolase [Psychrosphaera sp.]
RVDHFSNQVVELSGALYDPTTLVKEDGTLRKLTLSGSTNANAALALMETDFSRLDYSKVVSTQLIWGADDTVAPVRTGVAIADVLTRAELHLIADAGHVPMKSKTQQFNQTLLSALANDPVTVNKVPPKPSKRIGQCVHDDQTEFNGFYQTLTLNNCKLVKLNNVVAKNFSVNESYVEIQNSALGSLDSVINIKDSAVKATASIFYGKLVSDDSRFDFASVDFQAGEVAFESVDDTLMIISLSNINSTTYQGVAHGFFELNKGSLDQHLFQEKLQEPSRKDH